MSSTADEPQRRRAFSIVFLVLMTTATGNTALQSVLPSIGREIGVSDTLVAAVYSLSALFWTISAPFWAAQSDRRGRKSMMMLGLTGFVVSMTAFGLIVLAGLYDMAAPIVIFAGLLIGRGVFGVFGSAAPGAAQAYVADRTRREERTGALSTLASAFGIGTVLGPALAPFFLLPFLGLSGPMLMFALIGTGVLLLVWKGLPSGDVVRTTVHASAPRRGFWKDPRVAPFVAYGFTLGSAQAVNGQTLGFLVIDKLASSPAEAQSFIGVAMLAGAGATLLAQWGLIRMLRLSPPDLLRWGAGLAIVGNVMIAAAPDYFTVVIGFATASLGYGFGRPGFTAGASLAVEPEEQGAVAGVVTALNGACWLIAPILGVALYEWIGPLPFLLNVIVLGGLLAFAVFEKKLNQPGLVSTPESHPVG